MRAWSRQTQTGSSTSMPERLLLPASTGLRDQTGLCWMREFRHRESLAREAVTKEAPVLPALSSGSRVLRTEMPTKGIAGASTRCLSGEGADVYAMNLYHRHYGQAHHGLEAARACRSTA